MTPRGAGTHSAGVVGGAESVPTAPLIRVLSWLRIRVAAIYTVHTDLVRRILEELCYSHPEQEHKDQQQHND